MRSPQSQRILIYLIREMITDRFKRLARDEVLSKFIFSEMDPAALIDAYVHAEKEALALSQQTLVELYSTTRLQEHLHAASLRIHQRLCEIYGTRFEEGLLSDGALAARCVWLKARVDFYSQWMSVETTAHTPESLARDAFKTSKNFRAKIDQILAAEADLHAAVIRFVPTTYRLLYTRQCEHEIQRAQSLWQEFVLEVFKEAKQLPEI